MKKRLSETTVVTEIVTVQLNVKGSYPVLARVARFVHTRLAQACFSRGRRNSRTMRHAKRPESAILGSRKVAVLGTFDNGMEKGNGGIHQCKPHVARTGRVFVDGY